MTETFYTIYTSFDRSQVNNGCGRFCTDTLQPTTRVFSIRLSLASVVRPAPPCRCRLREYQGPVGVGGSDGDGQPSSQPTAGLLSGRGGPGSGCTRPPPAARHGAPPVAVRAAAVADCPPAGRRRRRPVHAERLSLRGRLLLGHGRSDGAAERPAARPERPPGAGFPDQLSAAPAPVQSEVVPGSTGRRQLQAR